jgi:hypothetical protein
MHGDFEVELELLAILSRRCGQLLLYPDTGNPAVIVLPGMDVGRAFKLWEAALEQEDSWEYFYSRMGY